MSEELIFLRKENEFLKLKNKKLMEMLSEMRQTFELMQIKFNEFDYNYKQLIDENINTNEVKVEINESNEHIIGEQILTENNNSIDIFLPLNQTSNSSQELINNSIEMKKSFKCDFNDCNYGTNCKKNIERHKKNIHCLDEKRFRCEWNECFYSTQVKSHFTIHMRKHTGEKPFHCSYQMCNYSAASSSQVSRHKRIHYFNK
jgi:hypothetical protein